MKLGEKLKQLYDTADSLDAEIPAQLSKQIEVYCEILMVVGKLHAVAQYEYGKAYATRKMVHGVSLAETSGTQADKQGQAEKDAYEHRLEEAKAEAELVRWKNLFVATTELIQAKKKSLDLMRTELNMTR